MFINRSKYLFLTIYICVCLCTPLLTYSIDIDNLSKENVETLNIDSKTSLETDETKANDKSAIESDTNSQEVESSNTKTDAENDKEQDLFMQTVALDIAGSDYYALLSWVEELKLPSQGTINDLRKSLYDYYKVSAPKQAKTSSKIITIESADRTEYFSAKSDGESSVRFTGKVVIQVQDNENNESMSLQADEVVINQTQNLLAAKGDIKFERKKADSTDYFLGSYIELDMDDWSGAFLDGQNKQDTKSTSKDALVFLADDIVKQGKDVLVFKDGIVSSCNDEHPHYAIRAKKIWILGGNEWAMRDITLSVGEIPVLYLPFFYYPGEEIAFHPVLGYEDKFGRFVQTTTYLVGEKAPEEQEISLLKIADSQNSYEKKVQGVFLRTGDKTKKSTTSDFVKVIADVYSNLGAYAGLDFSVAKLWKFSSFKGFLGFGVTRSIFNTGSMYTPFVAANDYSSTWNTIDLFGNTIPFRFGFNVSSSVSFNIFKLSFAFPFYTDPYFNQDFTDRSENMNWFSFLDSETSTTSISKISSFIDTVSMTASVPTKVLPNWISKISLTKFSSQLNWSNKSKQSPIDVTKAKLFAVDPNRDFFVPYEWTYVDAAGSFSGTIFSIPFISNKKNSSTKVATEEQTEKNIDTETNMLKDSVDDYLKKDASLVSPWEKNEEEKESEKDKTEKSTPITFVPPSILKPNAAPSWKDYTTSLTWSWTPSITWKRRYLLDSWAEPNDVDMAPLYELRTIKNTGTLNYNSAINGNLLKTNITFTGLSQFQDRPNICSDTSYVTTTLLDAWALTDAQYRKDKLSSSISVSSNPFQDIWMFSSSAISYKMGSTIYEKLFDSIDINNNASYEDKWISWSKDTITSHELALTLAAKPWGYVQSAKISAYLPPVSEKYTGSLSFSLPDTAITVNTSLIKEDTYSEYEWNPLSTSLTFSKDKWPKLTGSFIWSLQEKSPASAALELSYKGFSASFSAKDAILYNIVEDEGWVSETESKFMITNVMAAYKQTWKPPKDWQGKLKWDVSLNTNANQSFVRFTDSYLNFILSLNLEVTDLISIKLSSTSKNSSLWRYYPQLFDIPSFYNIEAVNPLEDLIQSFNFFDSTGNARRDSLFKLKAISASVVCDLHDWDLSFTFSMSPELNSDTLDYYFKSSFKITLAWRQVSQIKTSYEKNGDVITWD